MHRMMLKSKIHRATVTGADLHYVGSLTVSPELMAAADLLPDEQVDVLDINNGNRLTTYVIEGPPGTGTMGINGAAARLVLPGDVIIVVSYAQYSRDELRGHTPTVVIVDDHNRIVSEAGGHAPVGPLGPITA